MESSSTAEGARHRGRLQVQGEDLNPELSYPWAQDEPLKANVALNELENLKQRLTQEQLKRRDRAFRKAEAWIKKVRDQGGVDAPRRPKSFHNRPKPKDYPKARIDIEVITGKAFVP